MHTGVVAKSCAASSPASRTKLTSLSGLLRGRYLSKAALLQIFELYRRQLRATAEAGFQSLPIREVFAPNMQGTPADVCFDVLQKLCMLRQLYVVLRKIHEGHLPLQDMLWFVLWSSQCTVLMCKS